MKIKIIIYTLTLLVCFVVSGRAVTYYVDTTCSDGSTYDPNTPACTGGNDIVKNQIADLNSIDFADADIISFRKGQTFRDAQLNLGAITSPGTKTITIQSHGSGNLPVIGATSHSVSISSAGLSITIKDVNFDGQHESTTLDWVKLRLIGLKDITLDNIEMDGSVDYDTSCTPDVNCVEQRGIWVADITGDLTIKNSEIINWGGDEDIWLLDKPAYTGSDRSCISLVNDAFGGTHAIHNNTISHCESDGIIMERWDGAVTNIYDNIIWNGGENSVDIKGSSNVNAFRNIMGRDPSWVCVGGGSTSEGCNATQPTVQVLSKGDVGGGCETIKIYNNLFDTTDLVHIRITIIDGTAINDDIKIYNNYFKNARVMHVFIQPYSNDLVIFNNVFDGLQPGGRFVWNRNSTATITIDAIFYGNLFFNDTSVGPFIHSSSEEGYINNRNSSNTTYKNNIFIINDIVHRIFEMDGGTPVLSNNAYHNANPGDDVIIDWLGTQFDESQVNDWNTGPGSGGAIFDDPDINDPGNQDVTLKNGSPAIDAGETQAAAFKDGWNPVTPLPPTALMTLDQNNYGSGWEMGPYVFDLVIFNASPANNATGISNTVNLTWDNPTGYTSVDVYFQAVSGVCDLQVGDRVINDGDVATYDPGILNDDSEYCWRVDVNHAGGTRIGNNLLFKTAGGPPVDKTIMIYKQKALESKYMKNGLTQ